MPGIAPIKIVGRLYAVGAHMEWLKTVISANFLPMNDTAGFNILPLAKGAGRDFFYAANTSKL